MAQTEDNETESSLSTIFSNSESNISNLDTLDPRTPEFKTLLTSTLSTLQQCFLLTTRLSLFSPNEDLDDLSTPTIQYLAIPHHLSDLTLRSYDTNNRASQLDHASSLLESFLTRLSDYDLLHPPDKSLLESYRDSPLSFRIIPSTSTPESKRNTKIARFQSEKSLKSRLKLLREQTDTRQNLNIDDETVRSLYLAELQLYVHQAFAQLDSITQEREILKLVPSQPESSPTTTNSAGNQDTRQNGRTADNYSERLDPSSLLHASRPHASILDSAGRPLQPFTITSQRSTLRKGVFRPGHSLPTMSIEEYLAEEHKRGGVIGGGGPASERVVEADEDDVGHQDAATVKAREWDEFVEANPKGAGNTVNRG